MKKLIQSRVTAWIAFLLVIAVVIISVCTLKDIHTQWYTLGDEFFAFMMVFLHLVSVYISGMNREASGKLEVAAAVCGLLMIIYLLVEYFIMS
ncbi:MAG: hypothetical protein K2M63_00025 [Muribaculaceae bacterium]|nr:hypothetical protein [Muribaculaceae bacterium]